MQETIRHWWTNLKMIHTDGRHIPCSGIGRINIVKMIILHKAIYIFKAISLKLPMAFFPELEQKILKFLGRHKKPWMVKAVFRGKIWSWRNQTAQIQTVLQSYSNQYRMGMAQKQKYRSMQQDRKPRDKATHLWSTNLWQWRPGCTMEKWQSLQ